ncbi:MAG: hypothetical protein LBT64_01970 [Puniceicoccales bacterium]|nr:hypothetical protein [Puniceicoccales bacterium]
MINNAPTWRDFAPIAHVRALLSRMGRPFRHANGLDADQNAAQNVQLEQRNVDALQEGADAAADQNAAQNVRLARRGADAGQRNAGQQNAGNGLSRRIRALFGIQNYGPIGPRLMACANKLLLMSIGILSADATWWMLTRGIVYVYPLSMFRKLVVLFNCNSAHAASKSIIDKVASFAAESPIVIIGAACVMCLMYNEKARNVLLLPYKFLIKKIVSPVVAIAATLVVNLMSSQLFFLMCLSHVPIFFQLGFILSGPQVGVLLFLSRMLVSFIRVLAVCIIRRIVILFCLYPLCYHWRNGERAHGGTQAQR